MPKRTDAERAARDIRERIMRKLRAWIEQYHSMCGTFVATRDPELALRLHNARASILSVVESMLPAPPVPPGIEEGDAADPPPPSVH